MSTQALEFEVKKPNGSNKLAVIAPTPMDLLQIAVSQNLDVDKLSKLLDLQMQWEANEARKAFVEAMNAFKKNPPTILRNKIADTGKYKYAYATLDEVCRALIACLSENGISHRWETAQEGVRIAVTCVLTHERGHSERTTLAANPDNSGAKNEIQQLGSTVSYLERYTLLAATGVAVAGQDSDAATAQMPNLNERLEWIANAKDEGELKRLFFDGLNEARKSGDKNAEAALSQAKNKRYRELQ